MNQQHRAEETRARILDTAEACFARYGYAASGVAEICAAAGVSKGAFYHHFPSKQAVFVAALNRWLSRLDAQLEDARLRTIGVGEAIERMAGLVGPILQQHRDQLPILFEFWLQARRDPAVGQAAIAPYRRYQSYLAGLIRSGMADGSFKPVDADLAGQMLMSLAIGLLLQAMLDPEGMDWSTAAQASIGIFLQGLGHAPQRE